MCDRSHLKNDTDMTNAELIQQFCRVYDEILRRERAGLMTDDDWLDPAQALREQSRA